MTKNLKDRVQLAVDAAGGYRKLGRLLDISYQAIRQWNHIPAERMIEIEIITGVPREELRPDIFRGFIRLDKMTLSTPFLSAMLQVRQSRRDERDPMPKPTHDLAPRFRNLLRARPQEGRRPPLRRSPFVPHPVRGVEDRRPGDADRPVVAPVPPIRRAAGPAAGACRAPTCRAMRGTRHSKPPCWTSSELFVANPLSCTMQRALAYGLPAKLEAAAAALGVAPQKDMTGPPPDAEDDAAAERRERPTWTPADYAALADYCARDVEAEAALAAVIPELSPEERELSALDAAMNMSGELGIDLHRVCALQDVAEAAEKEDAARCAVLTGGAVTSPGTQTARLLAWLDGRGSRCRTRQRATIEECCWRRDGAGPDVLRGTPNSPADGAGLHPQAGSGCSTWATRPAGLCGASSSSAVPGAPAAGAAGACRCRTCRGCRKASRPTCSPRWPAEATTTAAGALNAVAPAPVLDCVSWSLRSCLKATDDQQGAVVVRLLADRGAGAGVAGGAAGHSRGIRLRARTSMSGRRSSSASSTGSLGKVLILALGLRHGGDEAQGHRLQSYGVRLSAAQAEKFKTAWRASNRAYRQFWAEMEIAATGGDPAARATVIAVGGSGVAFTSTGRTLQMRLPSGRVLYYHKPRLDS